MWVHIQERSKELRKPTLRGKRKRILSKGFSRAFAACRSLLRSEDTRCDVDDVIIILINIDMSVAKYPY